MIWSYNQRYSLRHVSSRRVSFSENLGQDYIQNDCLQMPHGSMTKFSGGVIIVAVVLQFYHNAPIGRRTSLSHNA
jgi:hypothetical protein